MAKIAKMDQRKLRELMAHSRSKTPVAKFSKLTKRSGGALRQKALTLGIPLGHQR
jgi:hypothetical protein